MKAVLSGPLGNGLTCLVEPTFGRFMCWCESELSVTRVLCTLHAHGVLKMVFVCGHWDPLSFPPLRGGGPTRLGVVLVLNGWCNYENFGSLLSTDF